MCKFSDHHLTDPAQVIRSRARLESVVGPSRLLETLLESVPRLDGCPRYLTVVFICIEM
jgi:hypothetical protein